MKRDKLSNTSRKKSRNRSRQNSSRNRHNDRAVNQVNDVSDYVSIRPLHEHFSEYTNEELIHIKKEVCLAHRCPYLSRTRSNIGVKKATPQNTICNYILMAGHSRGCMPDVCTHYNDTNVKKHLHISAYSNQ